MTAELAPNTKQKQPRNVRGPYVGKLKTLADQARYEVKLLRRADNAAGRGEWQEVTALYNLMNMCSVHRKTLEALTLKELEQRVEGLEQQTLNAKHH
jgi:hypothetical protein